MVLGSVSPPRPKGTRPLYYPPPPAPPAAPWRLPLRAVFGFAGGSAASKRDNCGDECGVAGMFEGHLGGMISHARR